MTQLQPVVIIGTGLAGYMLAKEFRKLDQTTPLTLVTAHDGHFYSKPLLSTAFTNDRTPSALVASDVQTMAKQLNATIDTNCYVKTIDSEKHIIYFDEKRCDHKPIEYSQLVLACGADKIQPALEGDAVDSICSVNHLQDYTQFRHWISNKKHIAILGSGLVGCEFANDLVNGGYQVDMIAPESYPLARLIPEPLGSPLISAFEEKGVRWQLGKMATAIDHTASGYRLTLSDGSYLEVDGVFSAVGLRPHLALAKTAGLKTNRGIVVNRCLQTSAEHIFALGDCAEVAGEVKQYVAPILQCARALAKILAGGQDPVHYPCMPVIIKTPLCPVVTSPPPSNITGEWKIEGEERNMRALYYDEEGQLRGFTLIGNTIRDKMTFVKKMAATPITHPSS